MRRAYLPFISATAFGCACVAAAPILREAVHFSRIVLDFDNLIFPACAAVGGLVAGTLFAPAVGNSASPGWAQSAFFALVSLLIAAPVGGFLLILLFPVQFGGPGLLERFSDAIDGATFALLYLIYATSTALGIAAIAIHVVLVHFAARCAGRSA